MNATITYRKTKTGTWVAYGPAAAIRPGATVTVTKANGTAKTEHIDSTGKTFQVGGQDMVYGYIGRQDALQARRSSSFRSTAPLRNSGRCDHCGESAGHAPKHWVTDAEGNRGRVCDACLDTPFADLRF